jgi:dTDP-4-dehydrorhamnose 3,5-epimerase
MSPRALSTDLPGVVIIEPDVFGDDRGFFMEAYHAEKYAALGITCAFVQDNLSFSAQGTLRGLHYQLPFSQAKLVWVITGAVLDVAVDIRRGSPTFGHWVAEILSEENRRRLFIPRGFAHGFCVLSPSAHFMYKCDALFHPEADRGLRWDDPAIAVEWPLSDPVLSSKDACLPFLSEIPEDLLPRYDAPGC